VFAQRAELEKLRDVGARVVHDMYGDLSASAYLSPRT
jgi:hypothetical protein